MKHEYVYDDGGRHQYFQMKYKKRPSRRLCCKSISDCDK